MKSKKVQCIKSEVIESFSDYVAWKENGNLINNNWPNDDNYAYISSVNNNISKIKTFKRRYYKNRYIKSIDDVKSIIRINEMIDESIVYFEEFDDYIDMTFYVSFCDKNLKLIELFVMTDRTSLSIDTASYINKLESELNYFKYMFENAVYKLSLIILFLFLYIIL